MGVFLVFTSSIQSQTCCSGGIPLSNSIGLPIENQGTWQFNLSYDYNNLNTLNTGSDRLDDNARLRVTQSMLFNTGYSITNRLSIELLLTYINQKREITQFGNVNTDETYGIGDAVLLFKYNFENIFSLDNTLRIGLGPKIPFGATDKTNDQGILLNADLQPGSGAWDLILWTSFIHRLSSRPSGAFSLTGMYRHTGTNDKYFNNNTSYRFGSELQAFINYTDQFIALRTLFSPGMSVKYRHANKDEIGSSPLDNTGGQWVFIVPALNVQLAPNLLLLTRAELPVYSYVEGTQLTPTYRINAGLLLTLGKKDDQFLQLNKL